MIIYIYGGVSSGKSEFAEDLISKMYVNKIYLATMKNTDFAKKRIEQHILKRANKGFITIEEPKSIRNLFIQKTDNILLEDLTNLLSNNLFSENGLKIDFKKITEEIFSDIITLEKRCNSIFVVGNDIFSTERNNSKELDIFIGCLFELHKKIIDISDKAVEVIYGLPCSRKIK